MMVLSSLRTLLALIAVTGAVLLWPASTAYAQEQVCTELPTRDGVSTGQLFCRLEEPALGGFEGYDGNIKPVLLESPGSNVAFEVIREVMRGVQITFDWLPGAEPTQAFFDRFARDIDEIYNQESLPAQVRAEATARRERPDVRQALAGVEVPQDTGPPRVPNADGTSNDTESASNLVDPVNPATGEFYIRHTDLALPGFGISYEHRRMYRSRIDYDGPLGRGWDHSYNQRLLRLPEPSVIVSQGPLEQLPNLGATEAGRGPRSLLAAKHAVLAASDRESSASCGPELLFLTGEGTTLRFRETIAQEREILYENTSGIPLILRGTRRGEALTWALSAPDGVVRNFDDRGLLVSLVDANGVGLQLAWELTNSADDWRLQTVTDSVGRTIEYHYDDADRLEQVIDVSTGLFATYVYDDNGGLRQATDATERTETYEYDYSASRTGGDWVPEGSLRSACEMTCAPSSSSCDAGGACDEAVQLATWSCMNECSVCGTECGKECDAQCDTACRAGEGGEVGCEEQCTQECLSSDYRNDIRGTCDALWSNGFDDICESCNRTCGRPSDACNAIVSCVSVGFDENADVDGASSAAGTGLCLDRAGFGEYPEAYVDIHIMPWNVNVDLLECIGTGIGCGFGLFCDVRCDFSRTRNGWLDLCNQNHVLCCSEGDECGAGSCNEGHSCEEDCRAAFYGVPNGNDCADSRSLEGCLNLLGFPTWQPPPPGTEDYERVKNCASTVDEVAVLEGCIPTLTASCPSQCTAQCVDTCASSCVPTCDTTCNDVCHTGECGSYCDSLDLQGACEAGCVDGCIADSHGRGPIQGPKYGYLKDLNFNLVRVYDGNGDLYLTNEYGAALEDPSFDAIISQTYGDHQVAMHYRDLGSEAAGYTRVPTDGPASELVESLEEFESVSICGSCNDFTSTPSAGTFVPWGDALLEFEEPCVLLTGESSSSSFEAPIPPTLLRTRRVVNGLLLQPVKSISPPDVAPSASSYTVTAGPGTLHIAPLSDGSYLMTGSHGSLTDVMEAAPHVSLVGATGNQVYMCGVPRRVLHVSEGSCKKPFSVEYYEEYRFTPTDACSGELVLTPLATAVNDASLKRRYLSEGPSAFAAVDHFEASGLMPRRAPMVLRETYTRGRYDAETAPSGAAELTSLLTALHAAAVSPLLRPPANADELDVPVFVFHSLFGWDDWFRDLLEQLPLDKPEEQVPSCFGERTGARRGRGPLAPGPKPERATVLVDFHGVAWTYYFDEKGRTLRTVNASTGSVRSYNYDQLGQLTAVEQPLKDRVCMQYDAAGNLLQSSLYPVRNAVGSREPIIWRYSYTGFPHRLQKIFDPRRPGDDDAILEQRRYDERGNVTEVTSGLGDKTEFQLVGGDGPARGMPERRIDPDGSSTYYAYDEGVGTLRTMIEDADGPSPVISELESDAAGRPTLHRGPLGELERWQWRGGRLELHSRTANGRTDSTGFGFDPDGQLTTTLSGANLRSVTYDAIGNVETVTETALDLSARERVSCYRHGPDGRLLEQVSPDGNRTRFSYDGEGRMTSVAAVAEVSSATWDDACVVGYQGGFTGLLEGVLRTVQYNANGWPIYVNQDGLATVVRHDGFGRAAVAATGSAQLQRGYDELGNVLWESEYDGGPQDYGRPVPGASDLTAAADYTYDTLGRLTSLARWHFNAQGAAIGDGRATTQYSYEPSASRISVTDDAGYTTIYEADGAGRLVRQQLATGAVISTSYTDGGRRAFRSMPAPTPSGWLAQTTELTEWGAPARVLVRVGDRDVEVASWDYDARGRLTAHTAIGRGAHTVGYDAFDRERWREIDYGNGSIERVELEWSRNDWLTQSTSIANARSADTQYSYDALGRVRRLTEPDGRVVDVDYWFETSRPQLITDGDIHTYREYDGLGRISKLYTQGAPIDVIRSFTRHALTTMARVEDIITWFTYDSLGNRYLESNSLVASGIQHIYDGRGLPQMSSYAWNVVRRDYDPLGRLVEVLVGSELPAKVKFEYESLGPSTARIDGVSAETTRLHHYDALGRLSGLSIDRANGETIAGFDWAPAADGAPRVENAFRLLTSGERINDSVAYEVDVGGRLLTESYHSRPLDTTLVEPAASVAEANAAVQSYLDSSDTRRYDYDARHNWTSYESPLGFTTPGIGAADQYTSFLGLPLRYDRRGALRSESTTSYTYDGFGQLIRVSGPQGSRYYRYDALGRVVEESAPGGEPVRYAYDGDQLAIVARGESVTAFVSSGLDEPLIAVTDRLSYAYLHQDRIGSVFLVTDSTGEPLEWYDYTAYGVTRILDPAGVRRPESAIGNPFGFQGHHADSTLGLVHMRARTYVPAMGRFLSRDPIGLAGGSNRYAFVDSAPLLYRDPWGLDKVGVSFYRTNASYGDWRQAQFLSQGHFRGLARKRSGGGYDLTYRGTDGADYSHTITPEQVDWTSPRGYGYQQLPGNIIVPTRWNQSSAPGVLSGLRIVEVDFQNQIGGALEAMEGFQLVLELMGAAQVAGTVFLPRAAPTRAVEVLDSATLRTIRGRGTAEAARAAPKLLPALSRSTVDAALASSRGAAGQTTAGARALAKKLGHAQRNRTTSVFQGVAPTQANAEGLINGILSNPTSTVVGNRTIDVFNAAGQGVRIDAGSGRFIGFLEGALRTR